MPGVKEAPSAGMLSVPHLIVIFVVVLVIFGPQKLPELARLLGKATADFRRMTSDFRITLEDEIRDLDRQARLREWEMSHPSKPVQAEGTTPRDAPGPETQSLSLPAASAEPAAPGETGIDKPDEPAPEQQASSQETTDSEPTVAEAEPVPKASDFATSTKENPSDDDTAV